ncbi:probable transcriptional regulatory protein At2g25830 isoform X2 [Ananas comosus]|uniref:Probable transcriptional regulatory protein At2g25830 isoform X2 n=1 Tax=Ananas comosus TaxID=4615 RepID=A0A6P5GHE5_ANACO|nr:probable transcriptional regulatory protein At2g25830 isoform X2 [Ananas comosus]
MSTTARALGALVHRVSLSSLTSHPLTLPRIGLLERISRSTPFHDVGRAHRVRRIWTSQPVCMGRRSCKIAGRKDAQNLKKMKRNSKIGKEIVAAIKKGGPNPSSNTNLATILEKARELDIPKEIVERNIKKASEKGQETYIEKFYEDCGAKLADPGSIMFKFRRARVVNVKAADADKDQLLIVALDSGAEDVIEPTIYDDDSEEDRQESYYKIITSAEDYPVILSKLRDEGIAFEQDNGFELLPLNPIEVDDEAMELNKELMSKLLELDDVDAVYSDQK